MLVKCPECSNNVSSEATACPSCGHPMTHGSWPVAEPIKKVSHASGWISLAAFVLANFTPAILAPILVLLALIFAAKQLSEGGKLFGSVALVLALLQGWFVIDHFGNVSGSLGLVTAEDSDRQAALKYAGADMSLPSDWESIANSKCEQDWATDYKMRNYCIDQQRDAARTLSQNAPSEVDSAAFRVIRGKCTDEWPRDFKMRAYCEAQQIEAFRSLRSSSAGISTRNACAQKWPTDYKMRRYCETRG